MNHSFATNRIVCLKSFMKLTAHYKKKSTTFFFWKLRNGKNLEWLINNVNILQIKCLEGHKMTDNG